MKFPIQARIGDITPERVTVAPTTHSTLSKEDQELINARFNSPLWSFLEECASHREQKLQNLVAAFIQETGHKPSELVLVEDRSDPFKTSYYFAPKKDHEK